MKLNKKQVLTLLEDPNTIKIGEEGGKHDCHWEFYVAKIEDKYYRFAVECSYNEGYQLDYGVDAKEVRLVKKVITVWEKV